MFGRFQTQLESLSSEQPSWQAGPVILSRALFLTHILVSAEVSVRRLDRQLLEGQAVPSLLDTV